VLIVYYYVNFQYIISSQISRRYYQKRLNLIRNTVTIYDKMLQKLILILNFKINYVFSGKTKLKKKTKFQIK